MREAGYNLRVQLIDGAYLGAAHHRRRLIFLGVREDIGKPPKIKPTSKPVTVREAWKDLTIPDYEKERMTKRLFSSEMAFNLIKLEQGQRLPDLIDNYGYVHGRLAYDRPATTFTSRCAMLHPIEDRLITIPELKRIIGLPDNYLLIGSYQQRWECCIRCLPPCMMEEIAIQLSKVIAS
jgi:DNA (cytosine-5)-methyltransferase 1